MSIQRRCVYQRRGRRCDRRSGRGERFSQADTLEVGAGTGSSTASLLPLLPADGQNIGTDVTPAFFDRARERFSAFPFLRFSKLDLERDLPEQGFAAGAFDIVFSSNTVHATRNIKASLKRLRTLLAPNGTLLLAESTTHFAWLDMTIGLFEGWQHFADDLRSDTRCCLPIPGSGFSRTANISTLPHFLGLDRLPRISVCI